jgi:hypothetical protein
MPGTSKCHASRFHAGVGGGWQGPGFGGPLSHSSSWNVMCTVLVVAFEQLGHQAGQLGTQED